MKNTNEEWESLKSTLLPGTRLRVTVAMHFPFGIFVTIPGVSFEGVVAIVNFKDHGRMTTDEYPAIGDVIEAVVIFLTEGSRRQVYLDVRPSRLVMSQSENSHD